MAAGPRQPIIKQSNGTALSMWRRRERRDGASPTPAKETLMTIDSELGGGGGVVCVCVWGGSMSTR